MQVVLFVTQRHETPHIWLKIHFKYSYKSERVQLEDVPSKEISLAYVVNHSITQLHTGLSLVWGGGQWMQSFHLYLKHLIVQSFQVCMKFTEAASLIEIAG